MFQHPNEPVCVCVSNISSAKPKITYVENKTAMELEDQITLTCEASGDPIPSITWRTSTRNISNEEKVLRLLKAVLHAAGQ